MHEDLAVASALRALSWLVGQVELLPVFLGASGASEADLRDRAGDPEFLASVIDFILMDDAWVMDWSEAVDMRPEALMQIRQALPGSDVPSWT